MRTLVDIGPVPTPLSGTCLVSGLGVRRTDGMPERIFFRVRESVGVTPVLVDRDYLYLL